MVDFLQKAAGNSATTTLSSGVTNTDTSFPLVSDTNFLAGGGLVIVDEGEATEELAYYTGKSGGALTVPLANRGLEGGSAQAHASGATVKGILSADMWNNFQETLVNGFSVTTGAVDTTKLVTPGSSQTLTSKTLTSPVINTGVSGTAIDTDGTLAANSDTLLASQKAIKTYVTNNAGSTDGWTASSDTWTYASASSFTISGVDRTTIFTKGTRLKFTQTTAKYAVVTSSSFSTNTTVNIAVNTDYTIANAAITSPYYSYQVNPQGYPTVFNYSPTFTGFSANPTNTVHQFSVVGNVCTVFIRHGSAGTSNATGFTMTIPITALTLTNAVWGTICTTLDNSATQSVGDIYISSAGTTMTVEKAVGSANFTASNGKSVPNAMISYLI